MCEYFYIPFHRSSARHSPKESKGIPKKSKGERKNFKKLKVLIGGNTREKLKKDRI